MELTREREGKKNITKDLQRLWHDLFGCDTLSLDQIDKLKQECKERGVYPDLEHYYLNREELMNYDLKRTCKLVEFWHDKGVLADRKNPIRFATDYIFACVETNGLFLHFDGFMRTIELLGTEEQKAYWIPKCLTLQAIGCYCQTELGHGSDVQNLETTATYDITTKEYVVHSPTVSSIKFWPGGLGKLSNHAVVHAQLYAQGKHHGVQSFIVKLRDEEHIPYEGIHVGDIGSKFGFNSEDNGFVKFTNYRIPKENLLSKYVNVDEDGTFTKASDGAIKLAYGNMLFLRLGIFFGRSVQFSRLATIGIRYSIMRRQFKDAETGEERQIIDYQTQQYRLFPLLGISYAIRLAYIDLNNKYSQYEADLQEGKEPFALLKELHTLASCLKPLVTWRMRKFGEYVKQCCGGHGFLNVSGIHRIIKTEEGLVTAEGTNLVITQQTGRYLLGEAHKLANGERLTGITAFLNDAATLATQKASSYSSVNEMLVNAFERRVAFFLDYASKKYQKLVASGLDVQTVWNEKVQQDFIDLAVYFADAYMLRNAFRQLDEDSHVTESTRPVVEKCLQTYAIYCIMEEMPSFLVTDFFSSKDIDDLRAVFRDTLVYVRKNALAIVDGFGYTDDELCSVLGSYDGDVYNKLINIVRKNPLNKSNTLPGYFEYIKPLRAKI
jgi:acyl-CoA oxidase